MKQNKSTDAKTIVFTFFELANKRAENVPKHMVFAKRLLENYSLEDILFALEVYKDKMYSLGFLTQENMNKALYKREAEKQKQMSVFKSDKEVKDVAERNRKKLERISNEPRFGKGYSFDMLKEPK